MQQVARQNDNQHPALSLVRPFLAVLVKEKASDLWLCDGENLGSF